MLIYGGSLEQPPEFCDAECDPGEEFCPGHLDDGADDRADYEYSRLKEELDKEEWLFS